MALDEAAEEYLRLRLRDSAPDPRHFDPVVLRLEETALRYRYGEGPGMVRVTDHRHVVSDGSFAVRLLWPTPDPDALIVYYHGGGWVVGHIDDYDALARTLARDTGCVVALVNYRKAPEHPYPTPVNDALEGAAWAEAEVSARLGRRLPLIVAGDSAGGNLAAVVAQESASNAAPVVDLQVLIYPVLDNSLDTSSYLDPANDLLLTRDYMEWFWDQYVPDPADRAKATASPARAKSLSGLAPAVIIAAEHDVLHDEGEAYARRLRIEGVEVTYRVFSGQMHGFFSLHHVIPASETARTWIAGEIIRYLRRDQPAQERTFGKVSS